MMKQQQVKQMNKLRRKHRTAFRLKKHSDRLRLAVRKTLKHIYAQVIDDASGKILVSASDMDKELKGKVKGTKTEIATSVGELLGERCNAAKIEALMFDKGSSRYHGRVKAVAEGARSKGLNF